MLTSAGNSNTIQERVLLAVEDLPPDASLLDAAERLCLIAAIEQGVHDVKEGRTVSQQEALRRIKTMRDKWSGSNGR